MSTVTVVVAAAGTLAAVVLTSCSSHARSGPSAGRAGVALTSGWSKAEAERRVKASPPRGWRIRTWRVVDVECSHRGQHGGSPVLYSWFSCAITIVKPSYDCPSAGRYECVAGFEATVITRTLHVVSAKQYALYRG